MAGGVEVIAPVPEHEEIPVVDFLFIRGETPEQPMHTGAAWTFGNAFPATQLRMILELWVVQWPRLRQRLVGTAWEDDPEFSIGHHLCEEDLEPGGMTLQQVASRLMACQLNRDHPLWSATLVHNVTQAGYGGGTRSALVIRLHHAIADGALAVMMEIELGRLVNSQSPELDAPHDGDSDTPERHIAPLARVFGWLQDALLFVWSFILCFFDALVVSLGRGCLDKHCGGPTCIRWIRPIPLDDVRQTGRHLDASINDVLLACLAGAIRRFPSGRRDVVAFIPFNMRVWKTTAPTPPRIRMGNDSSMVWVWLPCTVRDPIERLQEVKRRMDALKKGYRSGQPIAQLWVFRLLSLLPTGILVRFLRYMGACTGALVTNVPGPRDPMGGSVHPIESIAAFAPSPGPNSIATVFFSYHGFMVVTFRADETLTPHPDDMVTAFEREFEILQWASGQKGRDL